MPSDTLKRGIRHAEARIRETEREHREASLDYLAGDYYREFPPGTFRPPIVEPYRPKARHWSGYV